MPPPERPCHTNRPASIANAPSVIGSACPAVRHMTRPIRPRASGSMSAGSSSTSRARCRAECQAQK